MHGIGLEKDGGNSEGWEEGLMITLIEDGDKGGIKTQFQQLLLVVQPHEIPLL